MMAVRLTGRRRVLVARSIHPEYREVLRTYARSQGLELVELPWAANGPGGAKALAAALNDETAALAVQSPNFFGVVEDVAAAAEAAHKRGALLINVITEPVSLGLLRPPAPTGP